MKKYIKDEIVKKDQLEELAKYIEHIVRITIDFIKDNEKSVKTFFYYNIDNKRAGQISELATFSHYTSLLHFSFNYSMKKNNINFQ